MHPHLIISVGKQACMPAHMHKKIKSHPFIAFHRIVRYLKCSNSCSHEDPLGSLASDSSLPLAEQEAFAFYNGSSCFSEVFCLLVKTVLHRSTAWFARRLGISIPSHEDVLVK